MGSSQLQLPVFHCRRPRDVNFSAPATVLVNIGGLRLVCNTASVVSPPACFRFSSLACGVYWPVHAELVLHAGHRRRCRTLPR